jgi:hypothetical protein
MISLEASCMAALGQEFIWRDCEERLQLIADVAAPFLGSLPLRPIGPPAGDEFLPVIGSTMSRLLPILRVFAQENETLLISGPTGAGKSRLARWCHEHSPRRQGPFEVLDLMTVPEELQMAELFGWKKGAFTGAARDSPGSVTRAEGGTLFIMGRVSGRRTSVSSSAPMPTSSRPSRRSASERTSTTASMSSPSPCLRSTSARTRSPSGRTTWPFAGTASASRRGVCG